MIRFNAAVALGAFRLDAAFESDARVVALFGRSGAGKSVTIALIAGVLRPERGTIAISGHVLVDTEKGIFLPKHARRIGVVYQDARLFPHLTVRQNLMFGRWFAGRAEQTIDFDAVVDTLGIGHLLARRPGRLSGGERQRVAIGRALLSSPRLLLMDEPLAALDDERRREVLSLIERLRDAFGVPIVYVSHDVDEVARLASRVVVIDDGRVVAVGAVDEVFGPSQVHAGETRFGRSSVLTGRIAGMHAGYGLTEIEHPGGAIWLAGPAGAVGREVHLVVRATDITLATARPQNISVRTVLAGTVGQVEKDDGPLAAVTIALKGHGHLVAMTTRMAADELSLKPGDPVFALIKTVALDERSIASSGASPRAEQPPGGSQR
ncbi:MAG TPA: molybdenum ABC transporter ATP-binding protein [Xanthobacteraceae bacterium]|nr:molybdenum ABC transporter ATP-binding protein [Xanthobacteraceae bacterium]